MNSKCNVSVPLLLFRQLRSTILNNTYMYYWYDQINDTRTYHIHVTDWRKTIKSSTNMCRKDFPEIECRLVDNSWCKWSQANSVARSRTRVKDNKIAYEKIEFEDGEFNRRISRNRQNREITLHAKFSTQFS